MQQLRKFRNKIQKKQKILPTSNYTLINSSAVIKHHSAELNYYTTFTGEGEKKGNFQLFPAFFYSKSYIKIFKKFSSTFKLPQ